MECPACGNQIPQNSTYCPNCGMPINDSLSHATIRHDDNSTHIPHLITPKQHKSTLWIWVIISAIIVCGACVFYYLNLQHSEKMAAIKAQEHEYENSDDYSVSEKPSNQATSSGNGIVTDATPEHDKTDFIPADSDGRLRGIAAEYGLDLRGSITERYTGTIGTYPVVLTLTYDRVNNLCVGQLYYKKMGPGNTLILKGEVGGRGSKYFNLEEYDKESYNGQFKLEGTGNAISGEYNTIKDKTYQVQLSLREKI